MRWDAEERRKELLPPNDCIAAFHGVLPGSQNISLMIQETSASDSIGDGAGGEQHNPVAGGPGSGFAMHDPARETG